MSIVMFIIFLLVVVIIAVSFYLFYPQQQMPIGEPVEVKTVMPEKYHDDCLHPCIRYCEQTGKYYMAQSPYYGWNNTIENPMYYESNDYMSWKDGQLITDTPGKGYNSDPNIYVCENGEVFYIWRECHTPLCDTVGACNVIVGGYVVDGMIKEKRVLCTNYSKQSDVIQSPVIIVYEGVYYIYAVWYQYEPIRKNLGIAIWKGSSLDEPDFELVERLPFESVYTVDKKVNIPFHNHIFYIPKPLKHDMWHFDLFEYEGKLYMVSVAEKGDNIMLSKADDRTHFSTFRKPLVNNHYTENYCGYRQYYYKPTAFVKDNTLHLFYTANAKDDLSRNQLFHTTLHVNKILK